MKRIVQITSGKGPEECCFVVAQVLKKIIKACKTANCYHEVIHRENSGINGNLHSASLWVDTKNDPKIIDPWLGTIQWTSESPFRLHHKRKNWFVGVFEIENASFETFLLSDVKFEAIRSSGPGGQHVNKVSSAIRAVHIPTGLFVKVMDTRSQLQNKRLAGERIEKVWNAYQLEKIRASNEDRWSKHLQLQRGNPVQVFVSKDFKVKNPVKKFRAQRTSEKQKWKKAL